MWYHTRHDYTSTSELARRKVLKSFGPERQLRGSRTKLAWNSLPIPDFLKCQTHLVILDLPIKGFLSSKRRLVSGDSNVQFFILTQLDAASPQCATLSRHVVQKFSAYLSLRNSGWIADNCSFLTCWEQKHKNSCPCMNSCYGSSRLTFSVVSEFNNKPPSVIVKLLDKPKRSRPGLEKPTKSVQFFGADIFSIFYKIFYISVSYSFCTVKSSNSPF